MMIYWITIQQKIEYKGNIVSWTEDRFVRSFSHRVAVAINTEAGDLVDERPPLRRGRGGDPHGKKTRLAAV